MAAATLPLDEPTIGDAKRGVAAFALDDFGTPDDARAAVVVRLELGRTRLRAAEAERLEAGAVVPLDDAAHDPVNVYANGRLVARGDLVVLDNRFGVRVTELVTEGT